MFYSTDLLLRKDARFSLIWRLAITNGHAGGTKKRQILAVNIHSIIAELHQRIPAQPLTADQQKNCFSLRLISQLLYGTCIVLQVQISNLHVDAKHAWDSCRHIRFDEKDKHTKRRKRDDRKGNDIDWDQFPLDEPVSKKRKGKPEFDIDRTELHESQVVMGMDFLDRALVTSRSAYDITNITLPDDTMFIGAGMNDPMFIQPDQDLIPTTDAMMDAFLNGDTIDGTFTTKEASENRSQEHLMNIDQDRSSKRPRENRADSEAVERKRASSHVSHISIERSGMQQPLMDDMMMMDDLNLSYSMAGIEGDTRTSVPAHFVSTGPLAISTQVDPALEPILPSEPSQILPVENGLIIHSERDDDEAKRASAGSEERRRDIMEDVMMADEMEDRERERRREENREPSRIEETPKVKRRREDLNESEEPDERSVQPKREPQPIKLDGVFMKESMADYSDTLVGTSARRVKIDDKKKKKASDLYKTIPTLIGKHLAKNEILNNLFKLMKVDKINLLDDHDPLADEEERIIEPWGEIENQRRLLDRVEEEEEEEYEKSRRRKDERITEDMDKSMQLARMDDMMMMDNVTMGGVEGIEHMSVATIEGDWKERNEYMDRMMEDRLEERELSEEERRKLMEQRGEGGEEEEMEEARRRRITGMRMGDQFDLMDQFPTMMMDDSRKSDGRLEGEMREEGERMEMVEKVEWRMETEARVNREKKSTMAQVENHQAREMILSACHQSENKRVTLGDCIPVGANTATAARMFYNLLVLAKKKEVVPDQTEAYGTIEIGLCPYYAFPVYEEP
ncbi:hypothetical protein PENTCL1PPCAC_22598 [Pristionchus entomophagus]|uniref:Rad21/Rec8-like protein C-terminal eukaryotic domain-containing protein n=1 Tax=Pristionchus entomophagus TaxID=358040 RepID=A0AAV5U0Q7_9BILA|nr:hypothetical protein PENTCL1PPCAC_22598 [Pristionchus entomophagus]